MSDPSHFGTLELRRSAPQLMYPNTNTLPTTGQPPEFETRTSIISFSYDTTRTVQWDTSALRYYVKPPSKADLSYGYNRFILHEDKGRIDPVLEAFQRAKNERGTNLSNGVVSWRGVITKVLIAPYLERDECEVNVMYVNGTLYFGQYISDDELERKKKVSARQRKQMYYGYAFESYATSATPPLPQASTSRRASGDPLAGWGGDVNTNVQWGNVVKLHLGDTQLLIGGEVDCVEDRYAGDNEAGNTRSFVELKTVGVGSQNSPYYSQKLLRFYIQSFLLGVPQKIIVGYRTDRGVIRYVETLETRNIPLSVRNKSGAWDPRVYLDWWQQFIIFLRNIIQQTQDRQPETVWRVKFTPKVGTSIVKLDDQRVEEVVGGEDRVGFLPRWYWENESLSVNQNGVD
ncbi:hypothetical protein BDZ89DRAFT_1072696 [Hymenopellis radicata]|nr:hypothetical protein BDZ89DRAFT_1072696 [Hymenopellis radicata]